MRALTWILVLTLVNMLVACAGDSQPPNDRLAEIFQQGRTGVWVSGHGSVTQAPSDLPGADPQQRYIVRINEDFTVMILHSLQFSERVPAQRGDVIAFQGRYEWSASGGNISHTHGDAAQPGGGGWIEHDGRRYD